MIIPDFDKPIIKRKKIYGISWINLADTHDNNIKLLGG